MNRTARLVVICAIALTVSAIALVLISSQSAAQTQRAEVGIQVAGRYQLIPRHPHEQEIMVLDTTTGAIYKVRSQEYPSRIFWAQIVGPIGQ